MQLSGRHGGMVLTSVGGCSRLRGLRDAQPGRRQQSGHPDRQRPPGDRDHHGIRTSWRAWPGTPPGYITDGASVMVRGYSSNGTIDAAIVTVGQPFSAVNPGGFVPCRGTVSDVSTGGFSLLTSSGARVPVTTSPDTLVIVPDATPGGLLAGSPSSPSATLNRTEHCQQQLSPQSRNSHTGGSTRR